MKLTRPGIVVIATLIALASGAGCRGKKEITALQRKEAALLASEAQFAASLRNWAEAETALTKGVALCPDTGTYWVSLGTLRMKLGKRDGARDAYKGALRAFEAQAEKDKADAAPWLQQVYVLALLGRNEDARTLLGKVGKRFPDQRNVRVFVEEKQLEQVLADPKFKESAL